MEKHFVICVENTGYEASLEKRKIYIRLDDSAAASHDQMRIIDESGEDYLFPASFFVPVELPANVSQAIVDAA